MSSGTSPLRICGIGGNGDGGPGRFFAPYRFPNLESRDDDEYLPYRIGDEAVANGQ